MQCDGEKHAMSIKLLQSIFLIIGTAVGAGILALPISTVSLGFWGSFVALAITWGFMTFAALNMIRARLCFEGDVDLATMTTQLLGKYTNVVVEFCYLALLMVLVSMYITAGSHWVMQLLSAYAGIETSSTIAQVGFTVVIATVIYSGMGNLVSLNQLITGLKLFFLLMIIILSVPQIREVNLEPFSLTSIPSTFSMLLTTFGFSIVLPSLAGYLDRDRKKLYLALMIGSIVVILAYLAWELIAFGVIGPSEAGLAGFAKSQNDKGTEVINALSHIVNKSSFTTFGNGVMLTAVLTSFLGVGHCLFHYLKDALPIKNQRAKSLTSILVGFATPVIIINLYPTGISAILSFAGIFVAVILGILPTAMVLSKEYRKRASALPMFQNALAMLSLVFFGGIIIQELWRIC
jgi:tyrosine-specific transport protein